MKLCPFCGRAIEDDARYCSGCGKKINEHDEITHNPITEAISSLMIALCEKIINGMIQVFRLHQTVRKSFIRKISAAV